MDIYLSYCCSGQETARINARGYYDGLGGKWQHEDGVFADSDLFSGGTFIGLPPVLNFGRPELKAKVVPEVLAGKKHMGEYHSPSN